MEIGEELGSGQGGSETSGAGSGNLGVAVSEDAVVEAQQPVTLTAATEAVASVAHPKAESQESLETQRAKLVQALAEKDQALSGKLLLRIPKSKVPHFMVRGWKSYVCIFRDQAGAVAGVHPDLGPIIVTPGKLASELQERIWGISRGGDWSTLLNRSNRIPRGLKDPESTGENLGEELSKVISVSPGDQFRQWQDSLESASAAAISQVEAETNQQRVLPDAISVVNALQAPTRV